MTLWLGLRCAGDTYATIDFDLMPTSWMRIESLRQQTADQTQRLATKMIEFE